MISVRCYARVSTDEQAQAGYSLPAQRAKLAAYIQSQDDWQAAGWYIDDGCSAKDTSRPELQRLLRELQHGDVVLVYKLDRFTRSVRDLDGLLQHFERLGVKFRSVTENFDTTSASGRFFMRMLTEMAQWERETIAERSAFGKRRKVLEGEWSGGHAPLGYRAEAGEVVKRGRRMMRLVPDPEYAPLIPLIFDRYVSGWGVRQICLWLNEELGLRTRAGTRFRAGSLMRLLRNPVYCGDVVYGRGAGKRPELAVPATLQKHPPLISRDLFARAQAMMKTRRELAPRQATGGYPLTGVARCGVCGGPLSATARPQRGGRVRYYRCHHYADGVGCAPRGQRSLSDVPADAVESRLVAAMGGWPLPDHLGAFFRECSRQVVTAAETEQRQIEAMEAEIARCRAAIRRWDLAWERAQAGFTWEDYLERTTPHRQRMQALAEQLAKAGATRLPFPQEEFEACAVNFQLVWENLTPPERKALLQNFTKAFGVRITVHPDGSVHLVPAGDPAPVS